VASKVASSTSSAVNNSAPAKRTSLKRNYSESSNDSASVAASTSDSLRTHSPHSSSSYSAAADEDDNTSSSSSSTPSSKRSKTSHSSSTSSSAAAVAALANGSSVGATGYLPVDSPNGLPGVLAHLTSVAGWYAVAGGDVRLFVRRVPSPGVKRSVQTKQLRLLMTVQTRDGETLVVPYLLADLCDKKGISNKPGSKQFTYGAYTVSASDLAPSLVDPCGRRFEVTVLMTCEPAAAASKSGSAASKRASSVAPANLRSKHAADDPTDRMNLTLLYQTEPKFVAYRARYFVRQVDEHGVPVVDANASSAGEVRAVSRQLDLVEFGHNGRPTSVAHAGFMPVMEDWTA
jgi:hypothetical protein